MAADDAAPPGDAPAEAAPDAAAPFDPPAAAQEGDASQQPVYTLQYQSFLTARGPNPRMMVSMG